MGATVRRSGSMCLASLALVLLLGAAPASALQAVGATSESVRGVVMSVDPRVAPDTGDIVTDVGVVESRSAGGTSLTHFTMRGGQVGGIALWTEEFTALHVGDTIAARIVVNDGQAFAVAAPVVSARSSGPVLGFYPVVDSLAAGYIWDGSYWPESSLPVSYYINPAGLSASEVSTIRAAAQTWEDDPGSFMDFTYAGTTNKSASDSTTHGVNIVDCRDLGNSGGTTVGRCSVWIDPQTHHILEFDITFNAPFLPNNDLRYVATHEFGHTLHLLDLYDADNIDEVMYGTTSSTSGGVLGPGDIAGVHAIYPTPPAKATSISIKTTATTTAIGKTPILSGAAAPNGCIGENMVVYVMKPGSSRWTYSSNRTVYALDGGAAWQYKYTFKKGMTKGVYKFKAVMPAWPGYLTSTSPTTVSIKLE